MIRSHPNFVRPLMDFQIEEAAERYGYEKFIPFGFIKDLFNTWTFAIFGEDPLLSVKVHNDYDKSMVELIKMIDYDNVLNKLGTQFCFEVLDLYGTRLNFRAIEASRKGLKWFNSDEKEEQLNYKVDLEDISEDILDIIGVDSSKNLNSIKLPTNLLRVLQFTGDLMILPGLEKDKSKFIRGQMTKYSQISKSLKHKLIGPLFPYEFAAKKLPIKLPYVEHKDRNEVTLLVDDSSSVMEHPDYLSLYKAIILHYYHKFVDEKTTMEIYYYGYEIHRKLKITSKQELRALYNEELKPIEGYYGWGNVFNYFEKKTVGKELILLTDGTDSSVVIEKPVNNIWNIVLLHSNKEMEKLANVSNGKIYIDESD